MKIKKKVICVTLALFCLNSLIFSQNVSLHIKSTTVKQAMETLKEKNGYSFVFSSGDVNTSKKISIEASDQPVDAVVKQILSGQDVSYEIKGKNIVVKKASNVNNVPQKQKKISGVVTDAGGVPVIGANVIEKGMAANGTITDIDGNFKLEVAENSTLLISYIGFNSQEVSVSGRNSITIKLQEDTKTLDEVVVIGYGVQKKSDLTGAISSVKMDDTRITTISSIGQAMAGKAAGLQVNTVSAQPGGGTEFRIRGAASSDKAGNDPLIIIDGFPVSDPGNLDSGNRYSDGKKDNILASINPNDIESIEVLKDASSTAIYGARAGNGVIIVTTKRGKSGAPKVKYSGSASVQEIAKSYDLLDAKEFMQYTNTYLKEDWKLNNKVYPYGSKTEAEISTPFSPRYSNDEINNPVHNTKWFDEITRMGYQTQHNISMNGGNEYTQYLVSGNYFKQEGIVKNNGMERFSGRINLDQKLSKYIKSGINLTLSRNNYDNVSLGDGGNEYAGIMVSAAQFNPLIPIKDENGNYVLNDAAAFLPNPVSLLEITDKTIKERVLATVFIEAEPIKNLKIKANFGLDRNYQKRKTYLPKTTLYGFKEGGKASVSQGDKSDYLTELTANYLFESNGHSFSALGGYSYQIFDNEGLSAGNNNFLIDGFLFNNLGAGAAPKPNVGSWATRNRMASFFGRLNYSFQSKYLVTATFRADGASNLSENNRWGYFPSVALGWRFLEEGFMEKAKNVLSNGKLRISYGETGNSNIGNRAISYYGVGNNNAFGDTEHKGVYLSQMGNPNLKWETTREWNIGVDLGFINNRINLTAEYFNKVVSDLLNERPLLSYHEIDRIAANVGKTQSQGFELTINTRNVETKDFSWSSDLTFSLYRDKWKERDPSWKPSAYSIYNAPMRGWYGYLSDGLVQINEQIKHMPGALPGQVKIKDIDGFKLDNNGKIMVDNSGKPMKSGVPDGKLDDADKVFYGSSDPGYLFGFNNTFTYKNFDLNLYVYGQFDKLSSGSYQTNWIGLVPDLRRGYNQTTAIHDVWSSENTNGNLPGYFQNKSSYGTGDYYFKKIWFLRMRNITLGYNIPLKRNGILSNLRVFADVYNPFTITPYKGLDPETDTNSYAYPNVRSYSLGIDITF